MTLQLFINDRCSAAVIAVLIYSGPAVGEGRVKPYRGPGLGPEHTREKVVEKLKLISTRVKSCSVFAGRPPPWRNFELSTDRKFNPPQIRGENRESCGEFFHG